MMLYPSLPSSSSSASSAAAAAVIPRQQSMWQEGDGLYKFCSNKNHTDLFLRQIAYANQCRIYIHQDTPRLHAQRTINCFTIQFHNIPDEAVYFL